MKVMDMLVEVPDGDELDDGLLTVNDVLRMPPRRGYRFELHEGVLRMTPPPAWKHQRAAYRIERFFDDAGRAMCHENGIRFDGRNYRIPDVLVLRQDVELDEERSVHPPEIFEILVEVVSPSSVEEDQLVKAKLYAKAGIPQYWRIEPRQAGYVVVIGHLQDGQYATVREVPLDELLAGGGGLG
ncbi:Uma2 family endonuclease [Dactylosporangium siamense]|uniref:Putative restriction endonuclease domain-containing protein n=1 Tax=Dactylosporangium siamense TaxID=685454 RepID=A0A919PLP9_9ACTN|nr:Uma2 family endonuclease [Dactylosporangium siamense]GIG44358.1 hypothetical protein Dsi01nite_023990 [Dactylosporangium siamense]